MHTDPGIETHPLDDLSGIQAVGFAVAVELVEIGDAHRQISVGK